MFRSVFTVDLFERVAVTFAQVFLTSLLAAGPVLDVSLSGGESAALAGLTAIASLVKGILAARLGDGATPSFAPIASVPADTVDGRN